MPINSASTASECMSILTGSKQREKKAEESGGDFAALLQQMFGRTAEQSFGAPQSPQFSGIDMIRETATGDLFGTTIREKYIPLTSFTEYVRTPVTEETSWRQEDGYAQFREKYLKYLNHEEKPEYTDDMHSIDQDGERMLNLAGQRHFKEWRIGMLDSLTPDSIADAEQKYQAGYGHFNNYMHTMFGDYGIEMEYNHLGLCCTAQGSDIGENERVSEANWKKYHEFHRSEEGREMDCMAEEVRFYGAIAKVAKENSTFRSAYDADPAAALEEYGAMIASAMDSVAMPTIQTIPDNWVRMLNRA